MFIVVGLAILFAGWWIIAAATSNDPFIVGGGAVGIVAIVALAYYFTLTRRMVAPSIALAIMFGANLWIMGLGLSEILRLSFQHEALLVSGGLFAGLVLYWFLFRVPFTLALVGIAVLALLYSLSLLNGAAVFDIQNAFLLTADGPFAIITILLGLALLALAMRFDLSDPHRVTRRSACGFWLHIVAAPAIVNTVALTLLDSGTPGAYALLFVFLMIIAVFAIVIDRRSFLMAGAGYAVALSTLVLEDSAPFVILLLGLVLVILGAKWEAIRARILKTLPGFPGKSRLPPWTGCEISS